MTDAVDELMRVADAEAAEEDAAHVGLAVAIGIAQVDELVEVADVEATVAGLETLHHREAFGEAPRLVGLAVAVRVFEHENVVGAFRAGLRLRIRWRTSHVETALFVPGDLRGLHNAVALGGEEADLVAVGHGEGRELLLGGEGLGRIPGVRGLRQDERRDGLAARKRVDAAVRRGDERAMALERFL